jgi:monoamine oxidase
LRTLRAARVDAHHYEARSRIGGRVLTVRDGPVPADFGGQFINGDHSDILDLVQSYGLRLIDRSGLEGRTVLIDEGRVIHESELAADLQPIAARIAADAVLLDENYERHARVLDALSLDAYLRRHNDALTKPYLSKLLAATVRTEYGQEPEDASALELIFNLPVADGRHVELISASDERYVLEGGSGTLTDAMAQELAPFITMGQILAGVERSMRGARLNFTNGRSVDVERVVIAVPAPLLRAIDFGNLLPQPWRQYVAEVDLGRNEKLNAAYRERPWREGMGLSGDVWPIDGPFAEAWDATTVSGDTGLLTWFMGGQQVARSRDTKPEALRVSFEAAVKAALPALGDSATGWQRRTNWGQDVFTRGAYSCFRPGQLTRFAKLFWLEEDGELTQSSSVGPLVFAGEHLSDAWPGYMNGGAQTGRLAALEVLKSVSAEQRVPAAATT